MKGEILKRGAEAVLIREGDKVSKERISKGYRLKEIDEPLRRQRTKREANLLARARRAGLNVPNVLNLDEKNYTMEIDYIEGQRVDEVLTEDIAFLVGTEIAKMHNAGIIHGDLTSSNILIDGKKVSFIDFGLGELSQTVEKKGVDIKVFKDAISTTQGAEAPVYAAALLKGYERTASDGKEVLILLDKIEYRVSFEFKN